MLGAQADLRSYYRLRARQEMDMASAAADSIARSCHLELATSYALKAQTIEQEVGRRTLSIVAPQ